MLVFVGLWFCGSVGMVNGPSQRASEAASDRMINVDAVQWLSWLHELAHRSSSKHSGSGYDASRPDTGFVVVTSYSCVPSSASAGDKADCLDHARAIVVRASSPF